MTLRFFSLSSRSFPGFETGELRKMDLLGGTIVLLVDQLEQLPAAIRELRPRLRGLVLSPGPTLAVSRIEESLWHISAPEATLEGLSGLLPAFGPLIEAGSRLQARNQVLHVEQTALREDLQMACESFNQATSRLLKRVEQISKLNERLQRQVEELTRLQKDLRASEENLSITLNSIGDAVLATDVGGHIMRMNPIAEGLTGWSQKEALGRLFSEVIHLVDTRTREQGTNPILEVLRLGRDLALTNHTSLISRSGQEYHIADSAAPIRNVTNEIVGVVMVFRDVTREYQHREALKKAHQELETKVRERTIELQQAMEAAETANRAKSSFLAHMSHEIRNPMTGVMGTIDLLRMTGPSKEQKEYLDFASRSARSLLFILNDILDFSRIEAGKVVLSPTEFDLPQLLQEVRATLNLKAVEKGIELKIVMAPDIPRRLFGDALRLKQVLLNLGSNAVKFTGNGEIRLEVAVKARVAKDVTLQFSVVDTGIGISQEQGARIFQPFSQGDSSITREFGGTGLGLVISQRLVHLFGGKIEFSSVAGKGSTFWFLVKFPTLVPASLEPTAEEPPTLPSFPGTRVLVAEDDQIIAQVFIGMLEHLGCRVDLVGNGEEALAAVKKTLYDIAFLDIRMPIMDGLTAATAIRRLPPPAGRIPLVAATAHAFPSDGERFLTYGMDAWVTKPFQEKDLARLLSRFTFPKA